MVILKEITLIFDIANFPLLGGDIWSCRMTYGVSHLNRFARVCSHVNEFKVQNICQTFQTGPSVS